MAFTKYTGKDDDITFNSAAIAGWREITITENAIPLPEKSDTTVAGASVYEMTDDPLGGKGTAKTTITVSGLASRSDVADPGLFALTPGVEHAILYTANTGSGNDSFALTIRFQKRSLKPKVGDWTPFTFTFEALTGGTWATQ
jgi:hypothetical protein